MSSDTTLPEQHHLTPEKDRITPEKAETEAPSANDTNANEDSPCEDRIATGSQLQDSVNSEEESGPSGPITPLSKTSDRSPIFGNALGNNLVVESTLNRGRPSLGSNGSSGNPSSDNSSKRLSGSKKKNWNVRTIAEVDTTVPVSTILSGGIVNDATDIIDTPAFHHSDNSDTEDGLHALLEEDNPFINTVGVQNPGTSKYMVRKLDKKKGVRRVSEDLTLNHSSNDDSSDLKRIDSTSREQVIVNDEGKVVINDEANEATINTTTNDVENGGVLFKENNEAEEIEEMETHPLFSDVSNPEVIKRLCIKNVPQWCECLTVGDLDINRITEGLTNQLFKVSITRDFLKLNQGDKNDKNDKKTTIPQIKIVLFRIYGKDIDQFFDPDVEVKIFEMLSSYRIAPQMFGKGEGWRIEEWHQSVAVPTRLLPNPSIFCQVASHLARFHKLSRRPDFPNNRHHQFALGYSTMGVGLPGLQISSSTTSASTSSTEMIRFDECPNVLTWLDKWTENALKIRFPDDSNQSRILGELKLEKMKNEAIWLRNLILIKCEESPRQRGDGYDVVFCHNDCQENNLLQTQYGLRLIDFEYAHFNFQAYDIANFFNEWILDYLSNSYPYFDVDLKRYPNDEVQRLFCTVYLSEYLETPVSISDSYIIEPLRASIRVFAMANHILWGFWSVMRAPQTLAFDEFGFLEHAKFRFDSYFRTKRIFEGTDLHPDIDQTDSYQEEKFRRLENLKGRTVAELEQGLTKYASSDESPIRGGRSDRLDKDRSDSLRKREKEEKKDEVSLKNGTKPQRMVQIPERTILYCVVAFLLSNIMQIYIQSYLGGSSK